MPPGRGFGGGAATGTSRWQKARRARVVSPAARWVARRSMRAVAAMPGRQGCPLREGTGVAPSGMRRSASLVPSPLRRPTLAGGVREGDVAA